jgi:hypothetical protein
VAIQDSLALQIGAGSAYNIPTPLSIYQKGSPTIAIHEARYAENGFNGTPYYSWRAGWWFGDQAIELQQIHHKITLENRPSDIQHFEISHGYNLFTANWAINVKDILILRVGAGPVVTHPETIIRHKQLPTGAGFLYSGYYLSGATAQFAVEKRFYLWKGLFIPIEAVITASWARIPVERGHADVPSAALHGIAGLGYDFDLPASRGTNQAN